MKNYLGILEKLWEEMRISIQKKVAEKGIQSGVGFNTIKLLDFEFDVDLGTRGGYITEIGENLIFDNYGYQYNYGCLDYEQLAELTNYINTL